MKKNKNFSIGYCALALLLICGIIALLVASVNALTEKRIAANNEAALREKIDLIFGDNKGYKDITDTVDAVEGVTAVYEVANITGGRNFYCIKSHAAGYGGKIEMLTGFDCDGRIVGVKVLSAEGETPGLGNRIEDEKFLSGFAGKLYDTPAQIDGWSGSTVSSKGATSAVNSACAMMQQILGGGEESSQ